MLPREPSAPLGLPVAGALLAGVALVQVFPALPPRWFSIPLLCVALWLYLRGRAGRVPGAFLAGLCWACLCGQWVLAQRLPVSASGSDYLVEGRVLGLPRREADAQRFDFRIEAGPPGAPVGARVRIGWYGEAAPAVSAGSRWQLLLRLKRPRGVLDPGGADSERSALANRIAATGYVREPRTARLLTNPRGIDAWRERLSKRIGQALPEGRARFVQALALGDTRGLREDDWEVLRATGLTHQIAISGFHVGMVAGFGALLLLAVYRLTPSLGRRLPAPQAAALAALLAAAGYTALAGFALPTVRTLLMIAAVLAGRLLRRAGSGGESLALALIVVLGADPLSVLAPGFWLSFAGVAWLLFCLPGREQDGVLTGFFKAQAVAVVGLLPLTAWFFGQASLPGPLANLVGIPVISLGVVPLALAGLLLLPFHGPAADGCWRLASLFMETLWSGLEWIARWPLAIAWLPEAGWLALALAAAGAFWLLLPRPVPGKSLALLLFLPVLWPRIDQPALGEVDIEVLDVGQGLSVLVRTRNRSLLYDTGAGGGRGPDFGEIVVVPALRALGVRRLDLLMLSHGDADHAGGSAAVRRAFPGVRTLGVEGWAQPGMGLCRATQAWRWDGVEFRVLHPPPFFPYLRNDSSCVLRIEAGGRVALLPGDIGRQVEKRLLNAEGANLRADLLLVPHHGSRTSSGDDFVERIRPRWAVASAGADNRFGLPREDVVQRYVEAGARVLATADTGALGFRLGREGARLRAARRRDQPRYWRERATPGAGYAIGTTAADR